MNRNNHGALVVTIVRHGETLLNVQRVLQGHTDCALSDVGRKQAQNLGMRILDSLRSMNESGPTSLNKLSWFPFTRAYSSDLIRANETAKILLRYSNRIESSELDSFDCPLNVDTRLKERCYGEGEGRSVNWLVEEAAKKNVKFRDFTPAGGETVPQLSSRALDFFKDVCKLTQSSASNAAVMPSPVPTQSANVVENVLVVSHGGWIQALLKSLYCEQLEQRTYKLTNFNQDQAFRRIHYNTGVTKIHVSFREKPQSETKDDEFDAHSPDSHYLLHFLCINDGSHLFDGT